MLYNKQIVAVDDSPLILKMLEKVLEDNFELHSFSTASRALQFLKNKDRSPNLIILDIEMPEMNGFELLKKIKEFDHLANVPVIFLTSNKDRHSVIKAVENGVSDYVIKPIEKDVLLRKISTLLDNSDDSDDSDNSDDSDSSDNSFEWNVLDDLDDSDDMDD